MEPGPIPDLLCDLTAAQHEAVTHFEGPLLVLAGAGSGKTRVITRRVAWLLAQGVHPANILAITFTNKAAGEMRQRIEALVPGRGVWISTFHSFGARILRQYGDRLGLERNFTIYDQQDRARLVRVALEDAALDTSRFSPDTIAAAISKAKNQLMGPDRFASKARDFYEHTVARVYPAYEKRLRDANALDFDDLLYWPAQALRHDAELREELDARFRFVLIDEYQDTNQAQYAIVRGLSVNYPNLCVVGDPDQSIYKFRGSDIRNILDFERDFPQARVLTLARNYRSTKSILQAASRLIAHNKQRKPKDLLTENPLGQPVTVLTFENGMEEADGIATRIRTAVAAGKYRFRDFAIFVRMNALTRALETALVKERLPYQIVKGLAFFERKENRDILAYLRLLINPRDDLSFLRAVNEPARGIGKVSLDHLRAYAGPREMSLLAAAGEVQRITAIKGKAAAGLRDFSHLMLELSRLLDGPPDEVIRQVLDQSGYRRMLTESPDSEDQERLANIEELISAARQLVSEDSTRTLADFLENITLASDVDAWDEQQDSISIMTLHASKGLEFPVVFIAAMEQGVLPHERSLAQPEEMEEERRLAFVGMTRAREELYLCHARMRDFRGTMIYPTPSTFLDELPAEEIQHIDLSVGGAGTPSAMEFWRHGTEASQDGWREAGVRSRTAPLVPSSPLPDPMGYAPGLKVRHDSYGLGQILEISGFGSQRRVKIRFAQAGVRTFVVDKVKLHILDKPE